ncbi:hypothetical protein [Chenggangzhangella methanolivorans]|uniref:Uncharacterized protein n=1 Tax=Chenggangzhangella methanolivorans TaxID=1437009 RepID=A0A9E6R5S1_9HYPH|nr:hypothetical protein [Chenggangzhangella methanolivorans]QZN98393.1 hypothetical protein K6K41_14925 [Chenggangzhangella methanolivorans]
MIKHLIGAAVAALVSSSAFAQEPSDIASRDFSYVNPNTIWKYGTGVVTDRLSLVPFEGLKDNCEGAEAFDCFSDAFGALGVNSRTKVSATATYVLPLKDLILVPKDAAKDVIVSFRAPRAGTYVFTGYYRLLGAAPTGVSPRIFVGGKEVTAEAFGETAPVLSGPGGDLTVKKAGQTKTFTFTRTLKAFDFVSFGLNPNGDPAGDATGFDVSATTQ